MSLLSIDTFSLRFGDSIVVKNISLNVEKGEMVALVGESGSGKSLTALSCLGLQPKGATISGSITFDGQEVVGASETVLRSMRGKRAGIVFQEPMTALNPLHTIGRQIGEMISMHNKVTSLEIKNKINELFEQVGLAHFKDRAGAYPHELSGGERQRVMIAMAIANHPDLLIADEPTTAVDVTIQVKILALIKQLQKDMHMGVLFITHDLTLVKRLADRVAVMREGEIVEQGKVSDIFAGPKHEYTKKLLASEPKGSPEPLMGSPEPVIECENLKVYFPIKKGLLLRTAGFIKAVDGLTISVPKSSTLGVVGESGSGKTTLGFSLLRLIKSEGKIIFMKSEISCMKSKALRPLRKHMQPVFQDPFASLNPRMSISQIIEEGLNVHFPAISLAEKNSAIDQALTEVGLQPSIKSRFPHEFSGGQRQRIAIARAMALKPNLIILDEPTSALDLTVQAQIIALLKDFQKKYGVSYIFISHDLRVVRAIAHRIIVMRHGKMVEEGETSQLLERPKEDYTKQLIDAAFLKG